MQNLLDTIGDWFDVADQAGRKLDDSQWWLARLQRQHSLQIALDVIAHAQNIPLRLLRRSNLAQLDQTFVDLVGAEKWATQIQSVLREHGAPMARQAAARDTSALLEPRHVVTLRDWVLSLGGCRA